MSVRRSSSSGNLRSSSPSISKGNTSLRSTGKTSARSTTSQGSNVSDLLSVSPMKQNKKHARGNSARNSLTTSGNNRNVKPKISQSLSITQSKSDSQKSNKKPAWFVKQIQDDDTPRSEVSTARTFNLPTRPSIEDFLDFEQEFTNDKQKIILKETSNTNNNRNSLLEFLTADTARTDVTIKTDQTGYTERTDYSDNDLNERVDTNNRKDYFSSSNLYDQSIDQLQRNEVTHQIYGVEPLILEDMSEKDVEIKSWGSIKSKRPNVERTSSATPKTSSKTSNGKAVKGKTKPMSDPHAQSSKKNYFNSSISSQKAQILQSSRSSSTISNPNFTGNMKPNKKKQEINKFTKELAAKHIQIWWRKLHIRKNAGRAAMQRMMENKKLEMENRLSMERRELHEKQVEEYEQMKRREEKARQARQEIINEMHDKRQSKTKEKPKEKTLRYMLSNGKVQKTTNKVKKTQKESLDVKKNIAEIRPDTSSSVGRKVDEIFDSSSHGSNSTRSPRYEIPESSVVDDSSTLVQEETKSSKTTFDDLLNTLKELEDEPIGFEKSSYATRDRNFSYPTRVSLQSNETAVNDEKPVGGSLLTADKLKTIMSFLDEVEKVEDDVRTEVLSQSRDFHQQSYMLSEGVITENESMMESASQVASDISNAITAQKLEIDDKARIVDMMKRSMTQQKEFTTMQMREMDKERKQQLAIQRQEYEATIQRHLSFIDQLIDDKKVLTQRCEDLVTKLKDIDQKYSNKIKQMTEHHAIELKKQKEISEAAEKIRREKWIKDKTKEIKEMTVKGLEPDIQKLIAKHKAEIKKVKAMKQGEILEADERVGRKYIEQIEEVRAQLEKEKEIAVRKERENARQRFENQIREEEESFQQQRRRLYNEIEEEKERLNEQASKVNKEYDERRQAQEESSKQTLTSAIKEYEKQISEQQRNHNIEMKNYREQMDIEKQQWIENYMKKQDVQLLSKERQLKEGVREARDKEIEMVIARLEQETALNREEAERTAENRIKRIREKYENEIKELEKSESATQEKCRSLKERCEEMENKSIQMKSHGKQNEQELMDLKKITERLQEERGKVSDIIRQEFTDRLVALEEESKRLRNDLHEEKSRHRFDVERITKDKEDEMDEVHKRVKKAIAKKEETTQMLRQQMLAAEKRAEHLEQLLAEQRKKLLTK